MNNPQNKGIPSWLIITLILALIVVLLLLVGNSRKKRLGTDTNTDDLSGEISHNSAGVEKVTVEITESFPVEAQVIVEGNHPDSCTTLDSPVVTRNGFVYAITLPALRPVGANCASVMTPFSSIIPINVLGLQAGTYRVLVNGIQASFEIPINNELNFEFDKG
ncbi:MAG: hypothetical protein ACI83D_000184 [Planctomycetota bacterium]|jgi:hypothetical protein